MTSWFVSDNLKEIFYFFSISIQKYLYKTKIHWTACRSVLCSPLPSLPTICQDPVPRATKDWNGKLYSFWNFGRLNLVLHSIESILSKYTQYTQMTMVEVNFWFLYFCCTPGFFCIICKLAMQLKLRGMVVNQRMLRENNRQEFRVVQTNTNIITRRLNGSIFSFGRKKYEI